MKRTIEISQLQKSFNQKPVLREVNCRFEGEKIYGLLGRNGVGKSTLLNIINNRMQATSGEITLDGQSVFENDTLLQEFFLTGNQLLFNQMEWMTVEQCIEMMVDFYPDYERDFADYLLNQFALAKESKLKNLSTGYRSILSLVLALTVPVNFIFLDEPTQGLDANHREIFYRELLMTYSERPRTFVLSTHLISEVASIIEDVIILDEGKILLESPVSELLARGVSVTGAPEVVTAATQELDIIGKAVLGREQTNDVFLGDKQVVDFPSTLQQRPLDLQELFILLTNRGGA